METKNKNSNVKQGDWRSIVQGFVANMLEQLGDNVSKKIHEFVIKLKKRTLGTIMILIGSIFFLIGVALFINGLFSNMFPWIGWAMSGFTVLAVGYVISKE